MTTEQQAYGRYDRGRAATPPSPPHLPNEYLGKGYFDERGNVFQELVTTAAEEVAKKLGTGGVTSTQLRRFYTKAKAVEQRMSAGENFESLIAGILELKQHAANAVGRAQGRDAEQGLKILKSFIDRNVELAVKGRDAFRKGFLLHFQGVVAYFKYHYPGK